MLTVTEKLQAMTVGHFSVNKKQFWIYNFLDHDCAWTYSWLLYIFHNSEH